MKKLIQTALHLAALAYVGQWLTAEVNRQMEELVPKGWGARLLGRDAPPEPVEDEPSEPEPCWDCHGGGCVHCEPADLSDPPPGVAESMAEFYGAGADTE